MSESNGSKASSSSAAAAAAATAGGGSTQPSGSPRAPGEEEKGGAADGPIICPGHARQVPDLSFSKVFDDGNFFLISACVDNNPMLRDGASGDWIGTFEGHKGAVWCCRMNPDATRAVSASADSSVKLWDCTTGDNIHTWSSSSVMRTSLFTTDGTHVLAGGFDKKLYLYDLGSLGAAQELTGHSGFVTHAAVTPDANIFLSVGKEKDVFVWDRRTLKVVKKLPTEAKLTSLSSTFDLSVAVSTSGKHDISFWDTSKLELRKKLTVERETDCTAYDPASQRVLTGGVEEWVRIYSYETGKELACLKGHHGPVRSYAISPLGNTFASGSDDATIRIWDWPREHTPRG